MIQLLQHEAKLLEALKQTQDIEIASSSAGITKTAAYFLLKRMMMFGAVERSGHKKNYTFKVLNVQYEIIERRLAAKAAIIIEPDKLIESSLETILNEDQVLYLKNHKDVLPRNTIARRLGITKLQLNFYLDRNGKAM